MTASNEPSRRTLPDHSAFPALDGIRALAVAAVVGTHAAYWTYRYGRGLGSGLLVHLDAGVALFFVLSGFLLSRPWLIAAATNQPSPDVRVYFWRRALRILPMYWVAVVLAFVTLQANRNVGWADWLRHLGFLQIYHLGWVRAGLTQTWSLCTEVAFYLLLPVLGWLAVQFSRAFGWRPAALLTGCGLLVAATIAWYVVSHARGWSALTPANFWLPGYLSWFAGGLGLAVVQVHLTHRAEPGRGRLVAADRIGDSPGVCWLVALALFSVTATPLGGPHTVGLITTAQAIARNLLYLVVAVLVVWPAVFGSRTWAEVVFGNRIMRWLGDRSYSVFLLHLVVLEGVMNLLGYRIFTGSAGAVFVLTMIVTVALSALTFRFIEEPAMSLRRVVQPRRRRPPVGAGDAAPQPPQEAAPPTQPAR